MSASEMMCLVGPSCCDYDREGRRHLAESEIPCVEVDLLKAETLKGIQTTPEVVFHLAANTGTGTRDHRANDVGTRNLVSSLQHFGPGCHLIFTSSIAVADRRMDYETPLTETTAVTKLPLTEYGRSKLRAEEWLQQEAQRRGFTLTILRLVTVYGPGARQNTLFPVLKQLILNRSVLARVGWPGLTGLIHVDDLVRIMSFLARKPPASRETALYYVQGEAVCVGEVSKAAHNVLGLPYRPILFRQSFSNLLSRRLTSLLSTRGLLPSRLHGNLWRLRLLMGNVFWCDTHKLRRAMPDWSPMQLRDTLKRILK
jgi:nucleoside-diphosphate-sugar epimerase